MIRKPCYRVALAVALTTLALAGIGHPAAAQERRAPAASFDTSHLASQRREIDAMRARGFPHLGTSYEVLKPANSAYNCIAWSLGDTRDWVWPGNSLKAFDELNAKHGYRRMSRLDFRPQPGYEKIVLYAKTVDGHLVATHQARQMSDGTWTSKLGKMAVIRHASPDVLDGPDYGHPVAVYRRKR